MVNDKNDKKEFGIKLSASIFDGRIFFSKPKRGDIAVFKFPGDNKTDYIKRIIGLPGDTVRVSEGNIFINEIKIK